MEVQNNIAGLWKKLPAAAKIGLFAGLGAALAGLVLIGPLHSLFNDVKATGPIEYTLDPVNVEDYLVADDEEVTVVAETPVDASRVGTQEISVNLVKWHVTNQSSVKVTVQDTQAPVITFKKDKVTAELGTEYNPAANILQVSDPVDGKLSPIAANVTPVAQGSKVRLEQFYDEGWYQVPTSFVPEEAGTQTIVIKACDRHGNEAEGAFTLEVIDPLAGVKLNKTTKTLEYDTKRVNAQSVVKCSDPDTTVSARDINVKHVGKKKVTYTLTKHQSSRKTVRTFTVKDTKAPVILLDGTTVTVNQYASYDPHENIAKVEDPVDGALTEVDAIPNTEAKKVGREKFYNKGWYLVTGTVNTNAVGTIPVTVTACDKHGNRTEAKFNVVVVDPLENVTLTKLQDTIEYGRGSIDATDLVQCSDPTVEVTAPALDISTIGTKTVTYTLTKGSSQREIQFSYTVRDTESPTITISSNPLVMTDTEFFNNRRSDLSTANGVRAVDPVDGTLPYVSSIPSSNGDGWYTVTGADRVRAAGSYTITVIACDRNGNRVSLPYTLEVTETDIDN